MLQIFSTPLLSVGERLLGGLVDVLPAVDADQTLSDGRVLTGDKRRLFSIHFPSIKLKDGVRYLKVGGMHAHRIYLC